MYYIFLLIYEVSDLITGVKYYLLTNMNYF